MKTTRTNKNFTNKTIKMDNILYAYIELNKEQLLVRKEFKGSIVKVLESNSDQIGSGIVESLGRDEDGIECAKVRVIIDEETFEGFFYYDRTNFVKLKQVSDDVGDVYAF